MTKNALIAEKLRLVLIDSSPLIEEYTAALCPSCREVCCRQKHGQYKDRDRWYLHGLGIPVPIRDRTRPGEGPCEIMGPRGCIQPRWMRPFRCTWYFCGPLLAALNEGPPKKARRLAAILQEMVDLYSSLDQSSGVDACERLLTEEKQGCGKEGSCGEDDADAVTPKRAGMAVHRTVQCYLHRS